MIHSLLLDGLVWCPLCQNHFQLLRIPRAAKIADVDRRSIYRYIEEGKVHAVKIAGSCYRICSGCLIQEDLPPPCKKSDKM